MLLGVGCSRDDVAGIPLTDALPQKRRARAPGAGIGGVGVVLRTAISGVALKHNTFAAPPMSAPGALARRF